MKYYSTWQEALMEYIKQRGDNYEVPWNLIEEFELVLQQNRKGVYFLENLK